MTYHPEDRPGVKGQALASGLDRVRTVRTARTANGANGSVRTGQPDTLGERVSLTRAVGDFANGANGSAWANGSANGSACANGSA